MERPEGRARNGGGMAMRTERRTEERRGKVGAMEGTSRRELLTRAFYLGAGMVITPSLAAACGQPASPAATSPTAVATATAAASAAPTVDPNTTLGRAIAAKTLRIGIFNGAPYCFVGPDGKATGASVETMRACVEPLGITNLEAVTVEFGALIPGLIAERFDVITAGLYITAARCPQVAFGDPDMQMGDGFVVKAGNPKNLHSYADVAARSDVTFGGGRGSAVIKTAQTAGVPDSRIVQFASATDGLAGVVAGRVDCWAGSSASVARLIETNPGSGVEKAAPFSDPNDASGKPIKGHPAAAFRPADTAFRDEYNKQLAALVSSGGQLAILKRFGLGEAEMSPKEFTAASLCK